MNCNDQRELCNAHGAGTGGWPLLKHWSLATGAAGAEFPRKQPDMRVCEEISSPGSMEAYLHETLAEAAAAREALAAQPQAAHEEL